MNNLKSIEINNLIVFKHLKFPIQPGLNVIRGENKDAASSSGNAVGKSLLFGSVANVCLHSPPMAERKNAANTFMPANSSIKLGWELAGNVVDITQYSKGKSIKYDIVKNGKSQKVRTPTQMRSEVTKILPLTDSLFYSTILVSSLRPPVLYNGTAAQRYDFFEDIAELGYYDEIAAKISKKISEIKIQEKVMAPWADELAELRKTYTSSKQLGNIKKQIAVLTTARKELREQAKLATREYAKYDNIDASKLKKLKYKKPEHAITAFDKAKNKLESIGKRGATEAAKLDALTKLFELQAPYARWKKQIRSLPSDSIKDVKASIADLEYKLETCAEAQRTVDNQEELIETYKQAKLKDLQGPKPVWSDMEKLRKHIQFYEHQSKLFETWKKTGECPICKSHNRKHTSLDMADYKKQYARQQKLYAKYLFEDDKNLQKALKTVKKTAKIKDLLAANQDLLVLCQKRKTLLDNEPRKPKQRVKEKDILAQTSKVEAIKSEFDLAKAKVKKLAKELPIYNNLKESFGGLVDITNIKTSAVFRRRRYEKIHRKLNKLDDELISLQAHYETVRQAKRSYKTLNKKYKAAKKFTKDLADWQILHKMYGPTGMRIDHMKSVVNDYVNSLNNMADLVYSEPIRFSSRLEGRNFDLIVTRHNNPSDVRYLSGAQSRFFLALSALALRKLLPNSKQFNCLILDELDANVSTGELAKFTNQFLPFLCEEIPSVYIVTPKNASEWQIPNATNYKFTRKHGVTTVKTEQELQLAKVA